jgi:hypothetical protein
MYFLLVQTSREFTVNILFHRSLGHRLTAKGLIHANTVGVFPQVEGQTSASFLENAFQKESFGLEWQFHGGKNLYCGSNYCVITNLLFCH